MRFVLVHSPLVGPATWRWVAEALTSAGHEVAVPDLRRAATTGEPQAVVGAALASAPMNQAVIVGHSGAGFFLPLIADGLASPADRVVFVDAGIPPCDGEATASADFLERLRLLAVDGVLPRWSTWWGEGVIEMLVPDQDRRREIETEMPEVPMVLYESRVALPIGWCHVSGGFLLLSEAYRRHADRARSLEWPVIEHLGNHLDIVNDPNTIAHDLLELAC